MIRKSRKINKILISTMPRSGTQFILDFMSNLYGFKKVEPLLTGGFRPALPEWDPYKVDRTYLRLNDKEVLGCAHYPLNEDLRPLLEEDDLLVIYLYRDPRDVAVSAALYIKYVLTNHFLYPIFSKFTESEAIAFMLTGGIIPASSLPKDVDTSGASYVVYEGMQYFCEMSYAWLLHSKVASIRYEDFTSNYANLSLALEQVGVTTSISDIERVARECNFTKVTLGRSQGTEDKKSHYRKGIIGDYKNYFNDFHCSIAKKQFGNHLINFGYEQNYEW